MFEKMTPAMSVQGSIMWLGCTSRRATGQMPQGRAADAAFIGNTAAPDSE